MAEGANEPKISELAGVPAPKTTKSSKGWMITAIICALGFLGTGGYTIYNLVSGNNGTQKDTSEGGGTANCDIKDEISGADNTDTGTIAQNQSGDYTVKFRESGISLNLGSKFTVINYAYSQWPAGNASEQIVLGGLSENTWGYQNLPNYAVGSIPATGFDGADGADYWLGMATLSVYQKTWWEAQDMDGKAAEAEANGVSVNYQVVYRDEDYIVTYTHPQNAISSDGWEREWEDATSEAFETIFNDSNNWSR